jgi:hypothetical protein
MLKRAAETFSGCIAIVACQQQMSFQNNYQIMFGFAGCCVLMSKKTANRAFKNYSHQTIFELQETEIKLALENLARDD